MENVLPENCITRKELRQLIADKKEIRIIDVRTKEEYETLHIPGAVNVEISEITEISKSFCKTELIITSCGKGGGRSAKAAKILIELGFINTKWLEGGTYDWYEQQ
jgi:rhodanese-related sulfurtransferase